MCRLACVIPSAEVWFVSQAIMRMGHWNLSTMAESYLLTGLKPEALLTFGLWPGGPQKQFNQFWAERFLVEVPDCLVQYLVPWLKELQEKADAIAQAALAGEAKLLQSVKGMCKAVPYLARVVVQDALELADDMPDNPVHSMLMEHPEFR